MRSVGAYYMRVIKRAGRDAWRFAWQRVVWALLVAAVGLGLGLLMGKATPLSLLLYTLATLGGACVLVFLGTLVLTPVRFDAELQPTQQHAVLEIRRRKIERLRAGMTAGRRVARECKGVMPYNSKPQFDGWVSNFAVTIRALTDEYQERAFMDAGEGTGHTAEIRAKVAHVDIHLIPKIQGGEYDEWSDALN